MHAWAARRTRSAGWAAKGTARGGARPARSAWSWPKTMICIVRSRTRSTPGFQFVCECPEFRSSGNGRSGAVIQPHHMRMKWALTIAEEPPASELAQYSLPRPHHVFPDAAIIRYRWTQLSLAQRTHADERFWSDQQSYTLRSAQRQSRSALLARPKNLRTFQVRNQLCKRA